jgi:hypothetical protein
MSAAPVLVFDLDDTLICSLQDDQGKLYSISVNMNLVSIIYRAKQVGCKILLLTNNINAPYVYRGKEGKFVDHACEELTAAYTAIERACKKKGSPVKGIFDKILTAEDERRRRYNPPNENNYASPVKSLVDVRGMIGHTEGEIFFFDDVQTHQLCKESTFIHIQPPYGRGKDKTRYTSILKVIEAMEARVKRKLKD